MTAAHRPPHLVCAVPLVKDFKTKYEDYYYGGDYRKEHVEALGALGLASPDLILEHPTRDIVWNAVERASDHPDSFAIPMLLISGWYDHYPDDIIRAFYDLREKSAPAVRAKHKLMMGPWLHGGIGKADQGGLTYPNAVKSSDTAALRFFDHYLRGIANGYPGDPAIRYYQMGTDEWRATDDWYRIARESDTLVLYLQGSGYLDRNELPQEETDTLIFNPLDPSPTYGGSRLVPFGADVAEGPLDQRDAVENREGVLTYTTGPLERDIELNGGVQVHLYLSSDRRDTDIGVRLCDQYPDGLSMLMTQGITRMRFRNGTRPQDTAGMNPGEIYPVTVELQQLALTFRKGHRIRIIVSSSNYPKFDINPNTGGPLYQAAEPLVATNRIHMGGAHLSRVTMPVMEQQSGVAVSVAAHTEIRLDANMPNPFDGTTTIRFALPRREHARLMVYDILGRKVATLIDGMTDAGSHVVEWNAEDLPAGIYLCRLEAAAGETTQRSMIMRER
jgi:putative CocE/NonD family hydrolase